MKDINNTEKVIKSLRDEQKEIAEIYKKRKDEIEQFISMLKEAVRCDQQNVKAKNIDNDLKLKEKVVGKAAEQGSLAEWTEYICGQLAKVMEYRASINSYDSTDKGEQQKYLTYYCTYLHAITSYLRTKNQVTGMQRFMALIKEYNDELCDTIESQYKETEKSVSSYFVADKKENAKGTIEPLTEEVVIPKNFPAEARLCIGKYSEDFDISGVGTDGEEEYLNKETRENIKELKFRLKACETCYKKLIYLIVSATRKTDVFSLDFSTGADFLADEGRSHIVIHQPHYSEIESRDMSVIELIESAICRYLNMFPKTSKRIAVIQKRVLSELSPFVQNITIDNKYKEFVFTGDTTDEAVCTNAEDLLRPLLSECGAIDVMLGMTTCSNLFEYNLKNYKNGVWKQMTLLIVKDFPLGFNEQSLEMFKNILGKANKLGIYVIMTVCDDLLEALKARSHSADIDNILKYFGYSFDICSDEKGYTYSMVSRSSYEKVNFGEYSLNNRTFRREKYFSDLEKKMLAADDPAIPLQSLFEDGLKNTEIAQDDRRNDFFRVLTFPIGKVGTRRRSMDLHQSGGGSPHVVIAGTTGSGKSVLLHDIILSAMCCYTPEELELYLFDFKETAEGFDIYEKHFPHVKKVAMECKDKEIHELLTMIKNSYVNRMQKVKVFMREHPEVTNTIEYNRYARENGLKQIPRMIVVIDEYQTITSDENLSLLLEIAQKGREYGVVLVMASQSNSVNSFGNIIKLFGHRIEFKNEPLGALVSRAASRSRELFGPKGLCFYSSDGSSGTPVLLRCAFVNKKKDLPDLIRYIERKYAAYPVNTYKIGSVKCIMRACGYSPKNGFQSFAEMEESGETIYEGEAENYENCITASAEKFVGKDRQNKGYILNLGLNSISLVQSGYTLDKKSPYMLAFGDSSRIESLFYSVAKSALETLKASGAAIKNPVVYYFNGKEKFDKDTPLYALKDCPSWVSFAINKEAAEKAVSELYEEYKRRKSLKDYKYAPTIVMISEFNTFISLLGLENDGGEDNTSVVIVRDEDAVKSKASEFMAKFGDWGSAVPPKGSKPATEQDSMQEEKPAQEEKSADITAGYKMKKLLSADGGEYGFFFCLQISDSSRNNYLKKHVEMSKLNTVIYLDSNGGSENDFDSDGIMQISSFLKIILPARRAKIGTSDTKRDYAYRFTNDKTKEFIPYEYKNQD